MKAIVCMSCTILFAMLCGLPLSPVLAQSALDENVSSLNKRGKHLEAVAAYRAASEERHTLADKIAAAQSSWAAGMADYSRTLWNEILANPEFKGTEKHRAILSLAMLELQEYKFDKARALAERALPEMEATDLKAQFLLLIGEALTEQGAYSKAEQYYREAADIGNDVIRSEAKYYLGENQLHIGKQDAARLSFSEVEMASDYAPKALLHLIKIDSDQGHFDGVLTWVREGREEFPLQFEEPWVRYSVIVALIETNQTEKATLEIKNFKTRYSDQDPWFVLANAAYENKEVGADLAEIDPQKTPEVIGAIRDVASSEVSQKLRLGNLATQSAAVAPVKNKPAVKVTNARNK